MFIKGQVITVEGDDLCATITNKRSILGIEHNWDNEELCNFEIVILLEKDQSSFDSDPHLHLNANAILKK